MKRNDKYICPICEHEIETSPCCFQCLEDYKLTDTNYNLYGKVRGLYKYFQNILTKKEIKETFTLGQFFAWFIKQNNQCTYCSKPYDFNYQNFSIIGTNPSNMRLVCNTCKSLLLEFPHEKMLLIGKDIQKYR